VTHLDFEALGDMLRGCWGKLRTFPHHRVAWIVWMCKASNMFHIQWVEEE